MTDGQTVTISCLFLDQSALKIPQSWWNCLGRAEQERADRLRVAAERRHFIAAHALLRHRLGQMTDTAPDRVRINALPGAKPELVEKTDLSFSLSHTKGLVAVAVSRAGAVGIDAEAKDLAASPLQIAGACFAPAEIRALQQTPEPQRLTQFFQIWTLKEAYLKACGCGLSRDLASFTISLNPPELAEGDEPASWQFFQQQWDDSHYLAIALNRPRQTPAKFSLEQLDENWL